ncbi:MAG: c-type cytochrome biogenesis protein CcmI [Proteobacteria bacterium]|nr:c-type cytochrome biogenesis protein CcmI [Pseudomonadota bacterium]
MTFWIAVAVLTIAILGVALRPLLRRSATHAARATYDANVYRDQLKELERDAADGRIGAGELAAARLEIERRLLSAVADTSEPSADAPDGKAGRLLAVALGLVLPVLAALLYLDLGRPGTPDYPLAGRAGAGGSASATRTASGMAGSMSDALEKLKSKLEKDPTDVDGWILLGRTYANMDRAADAADAYAKALPLTDRHPMLLADYAEARIVAAGGAMSKDIHADFAEAVRRDPTLSKPWFYLGLGKAQDGDFRGAVQFWTDLLAIAPPDAPYVAGVREQIGLAGKDGGFDPKEILPSEMARQVAANLPRQSMPSTAPGAAPPQAAPPPGAPGPTQEDVTAAGQMSNQDRQAFIRSMVERLAGRLAENPNDPEGWQRLIRAYEVLGETAKAAEAKAKLKALPGN